MTRAAAVLLLVGVCAADLMAAGGYTFSCWPNGWRKNTNDHSPDIFGIETSQYGFSLDVGDFRRVRFGLIDNPGSYERALAHRAEKLKDLPIAQLRIELEIDGIHYLARACKAGKAQGVKHLQDVRMWESGRYVQHYDFLELDLQSTAGQTLACEADLDVVAWPGSLTFTLKVSPTHSCNDAVLRLGLRSEAGTWSREEKIEGPWQRDMKKSVSMTCRAPTSVQVPRAEISVTAEHGQRFPVGFEKTKDCYVASVNHLKRNWSTGYTDIRHYDEFTITVARSDSNEPIPFLLDLRPPANITGLCPILCDAEGRPTGIPVQLSKNWHYKPMGAYLMAYTMLPAEKAATYILRVVYGFYGSLPSASHAQLSLIGYGGKGRWDQLAIGCWGETICFDMDMSLVDVAITDIRMLMARQGVNGRQWGWTEAGWGGDWLNIQDKGQEKYFWTDLKTAYLSQGPCLTDVKYAGCYGMNREIDFEARIQTLRTDDYSRSFQRFSYRFTRDVSAKKMWLFKLGRTYHYHTPRIAYGNARGLLAQRDAPNTLDANHLVLDHVTLAGPAPYWVAYPGATHTKGDKPNGYRALIIRKYQVIVGDRIYTHPVLSAPVYKAHPTNLDIELLPPARHFGQGDSIELDLELITLPRRAEDYYGPNEAFRRHLAEFPNSWKTTYREAKGNDLDVKVTGGRVLHAYPLLIQTEEAEVTVAIKGGVGAVPICFAGLQVGQRYDLYRIDKGQRIKLDQSVHGNDFWQNDCEETTDSCRLTFNLPLDGLDESRWVFTQE